jgi:hypothetical protein
MPVPSTAGNDKKEPPPAIAFSAPASMEAIRSQMCGQVSEGNMLE